MRKVYITFTGSAYDDQTRRVVEDAQILGADDLWIYDEPWLIQGGFKRTNQWLWDHRGLKNPGGGRGYGWFSWKPYVIRDALDRLRPGDQVLYVDADTNPVHDFSVLFDLCRKENGHLAFMATGREHALCNRQWCKRECFQCMGMDREVYWNSPAAVCRFMVFEKGAPTVDEFIDEWQRHCLCRQCQTFDNDPKIQLPGVPSGDGPHAAFREHRTEQAIYSLLCQRYKRRLYREACEFGNFCQQDWEYYPQLFHQLGEHGPQSERGSAFREQFLPGGKLV